MPRDLRKEARLIKGLYLERGACARQFLLRARISSSLRARHSSRARNSGPILHVVRYRSADTPQVLQAIRASHYGLTLGVQTRLESFWREVFRADPGSAITYVNRNMIGAVVGGPNPSAAPGLSGDGTQGRRAALPLRASRVERTLTVNTTANGRQRRRF